MNNLNNSPLVYIVLPVYNGEKYFLEQLMSLYYQNYTNWYLIIVNDWSTDNSEKIARDWISHYNLYDKVKIINKENWWLNSGITRWLEEVKSLCDIHKSDSFVSFCDADDIWTRDKLSIQVEYMIHNSQFWISYHDLVVVNEDWDLVKNSQIWNYWHNDDFLYLSTIWGCFSAITLMFCVKFIDDILPMPLWKKMAQDYWTTLVLSLLGVRFWFINKQLWYRRLRTQSMSKTYQSDFLSVRQEYYRFLQERFPEKNLSYIIRCNKDWMINWRTNGRNLPYIAMRLLFKYPKVFFLCLKMLFYKFINFIS